MIHNGVCRTAPATPGLLNSTIIRDNLHTLDNFNRLYRLKPNPLALVSALETLQSAVDDARGRKNCWQDRLTWRR